MVQKGAYGVARPARQGGVGGEDALAARPDPADRGLGRGARGRPGPLRQGPAASRGAGAAREAHVLLQAGRSTGCRSATARSGARRPRRPAAKIELWEVSLVTFPMLPEARCRPTLRMRRRILARTLAESFREAGRCWPEGRRVQSSRKVIDAESWQVRAGTAASGRGPQEEVQAAPSAVSSRVQRLPVRHQSEASGTGNPSRHARPQVHRHEPAAAGARAETETPHKKAFAAYLRSGDDDGLRGLTVEEKALSTAVGGRRLPGRSGDRGPDRRRAALVGLDPDDRQAW